MNLLPHPDFNDDERELDRVEPAWADFVFGLRDGMRIMRDTDASEKVNVRSLLDVHEELDGHRRRFEDGHPEALLSALRLALDENVPVPYWASVEIRKRLVLVLGMASESPLSLHDAFGLDRIIPTTPKRYAKARTDLQRRSRLYREVKIAQHENPDLSLDAALDVVLKSKVRGMGKTAARELYLRQESIQTALLPKRVRKHKAR